VRASLAIIGTARAQTGSASQVETQTAPRILDGQPAPEPPSDKSAGRVRPRRGSLLEGKVAFVTGAARDAAAMVTSAAYKVTGGDSAKSI
jgi:hypothetical protein